MEKAQDKHFQKNIRKTQQKLRLLLGNPDFQKAVGLLRQAVGIPVGGFESHEQGQEWQKSIGEEKYTDFVKGANDVAERFGVRSRTWRIMAIQPYVLHGDRISLSIPTGSSILTTEEDPVTGEKLLVFKLGEDATLEDLKAAFTRAKRMREKVFGPTAKKNQPIPNLPIYERMYQLKREGMKLKDIADQVNAEFKTEYAWTDVSKHLKRYREHIGMD